MVKTYLLLGSNMGNRKQHLKDACSMLFGSRRDIESNILLFIDCSSIYETAAWGKIEQDDYLNQVIELDTDLSPNELLEMTSSVETQLGRIRKKIWEPRIIDIDILFFGNRIIHEEKLIVPHPHLQNRRFALTPLAEIAADFQHPVLKKDIQTLLKECKDPLWVRKYEDG